MNTFFVRISMGVKYETKRFLYWIKWVNPSLSVYSMGSIRVYDSRFI